MTKGQEKEERKKERKKKVTFRVLLRKLKRFKAEDQRRCFATKVVSLMKFPTGKGIQSLYGFCMKYDAIKENFNRD